MSTRLRVGISRGFDRCEILIADGATCFGKRADETDQRVALGIAGRLADTDLLELLGLQPREFAE
jgi:hypothetical protein